MIAFFFRMVLEKFYQRRIRIVFDRRLVHLPSLARVGALVAEIIGRGDFDNMTA